MFRSCRKCLGYFSQMKISDPEMFRNTSKIILGGAGNVLSTQKNFRIFRTRKSGVMNSKKYYLVDFLENHFFGLFPKGF
jgi:hypothetical protein